MIRLEDFNWYSWNSEVMTLVTTSLKGILKKINWIFIFSEVMTPTTTSLKRINWILFFCLLLPNFGFSQYSISGTVSNFENKPLQNVEIILLPNGTEYRTNSKGTFEIKNLKSGDYDIIFLLNNYETIQKNLQLSDESLELNIELQKLEIDLEEVIISGAIENQFNLRMLRAVEGTAIYAGKKTEVILLDQLTANTAANNARQIYAQIAGLNIFEANDGGLQLNIGGRGLDPNRTANFNTRQNGYDISADVLGYPESYYSPPAEALSEIQVIRGAASLQYGTQFGGLVNFKLKKPNQNRKIEWISRQTIGSNSLFTSFNSISGTLGKFSYYSYFNYKKGKDFRPNSDFDSKNLFAHLEYRFNENTSINFEGTFLKYLVQQPGGLTDAQFYENPNFSNRTRNWFEVDWKLYALNLKHKFSSKTDFSLQLFGLDASRKALGFRTNRVSQADVLDAPRDLLIGTFRNWGSEARLLHRYHLAGKSSIFLLGVKYYQSNNEAIQGAGSSGTTIDFSVQNETFEAYPNQSNFQFPNLNTSIFGEHIFYVNDKFSITPGFRLEYIKTKSDGNFMVVDFDLAGNPIRQENFEDNRTFKRNRLLLGIGASFKPSEKLEAYANFSQNYRSVTFNDIHTVNPSFQIDPNISDESGFTADAGFRGQIKNLHFDLSAYSLLYKDRLGEVLRAETRLNAEGNPIETGRIVRFRGNIGKAIIYGLESLIDWNLMQPDLEQKKYFKLNLFTNIALTHSNYFESEIPGVKGNEVEFIPLLNIKSGIGFGYKNFLSSLQFTFLSKQFTDASNAPQNVNDNQSGITGSIPAYGIMDLSFSYRFKFLKLETGLNNLLNNSYFTRRATGYPGPGIIPSTPRTFYLTLGIRL